jgi:hypothetical protein
MKCYFCFEGPETTVATGCTVWLGRARGSRTQSFQQPKRSPTNTHRGVALPFQNPQKIWPKLHKRKELASKWPSVQGSRLTRTRLSRTGLRSFPKINFLGANNTCLYVVPRSMPTAVAISVANCQQSEVGFGCVVSTWKLSRSLSRNITPVKCLYRLLDFSVNYAQTLFLGTELLFINQFRSLCVVHSSPCVGAFQRLPEGSFMLTGLTPFLLTQFSPLSCWKSWASNCGLSGQPGRCKQ